MGHTAVTRWWYHTRTGSVLRFLVGTIVYLPLTPLIILRISEEDSDGSTSEKHWLLAGMAALGIGTLVLSPIFLHQHTSYSWPMCIGFGLGYYVMAGFFMHVLWKEVTDCLLI